MDPLIIKAALVVAISVIAFIGVTMLAWKANVEIARRWAGFFRSLPGRWRMLRDPEFRKTVECLSRYDTALGGLRWAIAHQRVLDRKIEEIDAADRSAARATFAYQAAGEFLAEARRNAAAYFAVQTDEDIALLAKAQSQDFQGKLPAAVAETFLRSERETIRAVPFEVMRHIERRLEAYAPYFEQPAAD